VLHVEDWAEIRRLHRGEGMPIKAIARVVGCSKNTVRAALRSSGPPSYRRPASGSVVDEVEPRIRELLQAWPTMPATVVAERVGWTRSIRTLRARVAQLRPVYLPPDPASRTAYEPGEIAQCDFWFPDLEIPVGWGQTRTAKTLPVLTMVTGYSRFASAVLIPSRNAEDLYAGWWQLIAGLGAVPRVLVWDGEGAVGRWRGKRLELTGHCQAFRGVLGSKVIICAPGDPEAKGAVERFHHWVETSFLPGRTFASPADFNTQLGGWLSIANGRVKRSLGCAPTDRLGADLQAMLGLPPVSPQVGWRISTRLPRDYYVRLDSNDYSIHPSVVGRRVEVHADLARVWATCGGKLVADHQRVWARHQSVTEFEHQFAAKALQRGRADLLKPLLDTDVQVRHLASYDTLLGIDADLTDRDGAA